MKNSPHSLHASVLKAPEHKELVAGRLASIAAGRFSAQIQQAPLVVAPPSIDIPITTVSLNYNFDAYINVGFRGATALSASLIVDSGNYSLIVPDYSVISGLPNFQADYTILADNVTEPWGCPAVILRGPIELPTAGGGMYEIPDCVFYACTGTNGNGELTANFGAGCLSPWIAASGITLKPPLACIQDYPYVVFNYAPAQQMFAAGGTPTLTEASLTLYQAMPSGYQVFDILKNLEWMSLVPRSLTIGGTKTGWPGTLASPIAMVDTGGGPVFLSDPNGYVYNTNWPDPVTSPDWTAGSVSCESTKDDIAIELGDASGSFSYQIDPTALPASVQGLTLVMCEQCQYMMSQNGMNIGGLSALFNDILIDYASAKVGFKAKTPAAGT
jgi:hypothetical protein